MRIKAEQFVPAIRAARKTLTASLRLDYQAENEYNCIINLHNPSNEDFGFLYVRAEMDAGEFLQLSDRQNEFLDEVVELDGIFTQIPSFTGSRVDPQFKEWDLRWIPGLGETQFEISVKQVQRIFYVGKRVFVLKQEPEAYINFYYYGLKSETIPLPVPLQAS